MPTFGTRFTSVSIPKRVLGWLEPVAPKVAIAGILSFNP